MSHPRLLVWGGFLCLQFFNSALAANWLMLQGTEPPASAEHARVWGFVQGQYQKDFSKANSSNTFVPSKLIGPNLESQSQFNLNRARIGVRGAGFPLDSRVNYLLLAEFGNNGITASGSKAVLTDGSVTVNWIPFVRIRGGLFKTPGSEEALQGVHVANYINYSAVTNQLLQERFPNDDNYLKTSTGRGNTEAQPLGISPNGFEKPVGAFRDIGIQLFDAITYKKLEYAYAVMFGNGNGLNWGDNNSNLTQYYYASTEYVFDGKGARREGAKVYGWFHKGLRTFDTDFTNSAAGAGFSSGARSLEYFDRTRWGTGFHYLRKGVRVSGEFISGSGMIFLGPHKESFDMNEPGSGSAGDGLLGKARGWYIEGGWRVLQTSFELDLRYDTYKRLLGDNLESTHNTITLGTQYFINRKMSCMLNYEIRSAKSSNNVAALEENFSGIGNRLGFQFIAVFYSGESDSITAKTQRREEINVFRHADPPYVLSVSD